MKAVSTVVVAILIAGAGWYGWNKHLAAEEAESALQAIQSSSAQTERQLSARKEDGITFAEYLNRSVETVESLDKTVSGLVARQWIRSPSDRELAISFIEQCKAILRSDQSNTRLLIDKGNAAQESSAADKEVEQAETPTARQWAHRRSQRANEQMLEILEKQITAIKNGSPRIEKMLDVDARVKTRFGSDSGLKQATVEEMKVFLGQDSKEKASQG